MRVLNFVLTGNCGFTKPAKQANAKKKIYNKKQIIKTQSWNRNSLTERHYLCVFKQKKKKNKTRLYILHKVGAPSPLYSSFSHTLGKITMVYPLMYSPYPLRRATRSCYD